MLELKSAKVIACLFDDGPAKWLKVSTIRLSVRFADAAENRKPYESCRDVYSP